MPSWNLCLLETIRAINNHANRNIPAGHIANVDNVIAHYRKQHLEQEALKTSKA